MATKKEKSTNELLEEISEKLDKILALLAIQGQNEDEKIRILKKLGFTSKLTGDLLGLTESTIRNRKSWKQS